MIVAEILSVLLAIGAGAWIALPFIRPAVSSHHVVAGAELIARRDRMYGELRELEFDRRVGKVTDNDYAEARARLEDEAARVLRAIERRGQSVEDEIEREVQRLRAQPGVCPSCRAPASLGARFCAACGAALPEPV